MESTATNLDLLKMQSVTLQTTNLDKLVYHPYGEIQYSHKKRIHCVSLLVQKKREQSMATWTYQCTLLSLSADNFKDIMDVTPCFFLKIYLFETERKREKRREMKEGVRSAFQSKAHFTRPANSQSWTRSKLNARISSSPCTWLAVAQGIEPLLTAFPKVIAGNWIRSVAARTQAGALRLAALR